eukprot:COSAG02_NODE_4023_length_5895_cov_5.596788_2_plen_332_part_00
MAAEKRRKTRSTTGLCGAVLRGGKDTPEAILQAGAALAASGGGGGGSGSGTGSAKSSKAAEPSPTVPDIPKPRQAAHRHPDLREFLHPEVEQCRVGLLCLADSRSWDGTTDDKRTRAILRSRMSFAPPVPGIYDHAPWATKSGPRLRELLRLMQGEVYREGVVPGSQDRTGAKHIEGLETARSLLLSRVHNMGGLSNIDPEDMDSIQKLTEGVWIEEPDFEGNWDIVKLYPGRVQAVLELYSNERAMDLLMSWLLDPVAGADLELARKLEAGDVDNVTGNDLPPDLVLRLRVHMTGGLDSIHPNDEHLLREILVSHGMCIRVAAPRRGGTD